MDNVVLFTLRPVVVGGSRTGTDKQQQCRTDDGRLKVALI